MDMNIFSWKCGNCWQKMRICMLRRKRPTKLKMWLMGFSIYRWTFSSGWRGPRHPPLCVVRARTTLTVLICRCCAGGRGWLGFLLKVCNNDSQITNGNFQMLCTASIHVFQSWPGFLMAVLFDRCVLLAFLLFHFLIFHFLFFHFFLFLIFLLFLLLFLHLCRGNKLLGNLLWNQLGNRPGFSSFSFSFFFADEDPSLLVPPCLFLVLHPLARLPPCRRALSDIAHHALEGLGAVAEGADAAVPVALVRGRFRLPLRPGRALLVSHAAGQWEEERNCSLRREVSFSICK